MVALIDDEEATLKRLRKKGKALPLNRLMLFMKPAFLADRVQIQADWPGLFASINQTLSCFIGNTSQYWRIALINQHPAVTVQIIIMTINLLCGYFGLSVKQ